MKRVLFLLLWLIPAIALEARGQPIEVYANGHKYDSMQDYRNAKAAALAASRAPKSARPPSSDADIHQLYVLSVEDGVIGALEEFYQSGAQDAVQAARGISSAQLQRAIQEAVTGSSDPKLLIAQPGKVRIMGLRGDK